MSRSQAHRKGLSWLGRGSHRIGFKHAFVRKREGTLDVSALFQRTKSHLTDFRQGVQRLNLLFRLHSVGKGNRSEEHTSELQSLMRISYAVFCLKKKKKKSHKDINDNNTRYKYQIN